MPKDKSVVRKGEFTRKKKKRDPNSVVREGERGFVNGVGPRIRKRTRSKMV